jgi:hypothetical protein
MTHLSPDERIDAVEGVLDAAGRAHIERCSPCREEVARLGETLRAAQAADIPEPSPLFWSHFSQRVRDAIAAEDAPRTSSLPVWFRWPVLAPLAALALLVLALINVLPRVAIQPSQPVVVDVAGGDDLATLGEQEWAVVAEIVGPVDLDAAQDAGFVGLGDAERVALQLSVEEQRELLRLLQEEMDKAGG